LVAVVITVESQQKDISQARDFSNQDTALGLNMPLASSLCG